MTEQGTLQIFGPPHLLSQPLADYFSGGNGDDLSALRSAFPKEWAIYFMGGLLRNLLLKELRGLCVASADVDLVINGARSISELQASVKSYWIRQNDFGGAKCRVTPNRLVFDIWRIEDHVKMSLAPKPHNIAQLLKHNLLDVDAVLLDLQTDELYDYGCLAAIKRGTVDLLGEEGIEPDVAAAQVAHITLISFKTGFELSTEAHRFIWDACKSPQLKWDVIKIITRKMPGAESRIREHLDLILKEEAWPALVT